MTRPPELRDAPVVVLGAGIAGLAAARELKRNGIDVVVYEAGKSVGGMADSHHDAEGFTFDSGAHFITNRLATAVGIADQCRDVRHYGETVWLDGQTHSYPLGLLQMPRYLRAALAERVRRPTGPPVSAAEHFQREYGAALANEVACPLLEEWSGVPATELSPAVADKLPGGIGATIALKLAARLTDRAVAVGYCREAAQSVNVWHVYPERGIETLSHHIAAELADDIRLESPVERIHTVDGRAVGVRIAGHDVPAAAVVSTAPLNVLPKLVDGTDTLAPLLAFRFRPMVLVNMRLRGRDLLPDTLTWTPETGYPFFRLTETTQSMPWLAPPGKTLITADIGAQIGDAHWKMDDDELGELCLEGLADVAPQARRDYLGCRVVRAPLAYPIFHNSYEADRQRFAHGTGIDRLVSIGRNGEFAHILMEDLYWRTMRRMRALAAELQSPVRVAA